MKAESRNTWLKLRVSQSEKASIAEKAHAEGQSISDFLRNRAFQYRVRQSSHEKEILLHLARASSNLNQLARYANTYLNHADKVELLLLLASIEAELKRIHTCT